jgi:hypothetical protein
MSGITSSGARIDLQSYHPLFSPVMGEYNWIKGLGFHLEGRNDIPTICNCIQSI